MSEHADGDNGYFVEFRSGAGAGRNAGAMPNAPSRTSGGASGTLCHAYGGRSRRGASMDRVLSLDQGLLVVRLRDGQRARALRRAACG